MSRDAFETLLTYITVDQTHEHPTHAAAGSPVVTVARDHGAGGEEIAALVAERLKLPCFDRELLDAILKTAKGDPALLRTLDERLPAYSGTLLYASLMGQDDPHDEYQRLLLRMVTGIARKGGVIVGRGAHLLVPKAHRLRVRIVGSEEVCAKRLAAGDEAAVPAKLAEVKRINAERAQYIQKVYHADLADPRQFDLIVNTDRFPDPSVPADLIAHAARTLHTHHHPHHAAVG